MGIVQKRKTCQSFQMKTFSERFSLLKPLACHAYMNDRIIKGKVQRLLLLIDQEICMLILKYISYNIIQISTTI